mgnify:CR=1 FL=1
MLTANSDSFWLRIIYIVSVIISGAVAFLILGPRPVGIEGSLDVSVLPILNATLNGITTVLLIVGYSLIRQKKRQQHKNVMLSAFGTSTAFLISYVIYHWFKSGPKLYTRSEEHTSELQSLAYLVCRLLLEKKKQKKHKYII